MLRRPTHQFGPTAYWRVPPKRPERHRVGEHNRPSGWQDRQADDAADQEPSYLELRPRTASNAHRALATAAAPPQARLELDATPRRKGAIGTDVRSLFDSCSQ